MDTSLFIFQAEKNPKYVSLTHRVFNWLKSPKGRAVTSTITMLEFLVHPYRDSDEDHVNTYYALLATYPHLEWAETTLPIADRAAQFRGKFNLRTPDAMQAATTVLAGATGFISNDPIFRRIPDLDALTLDDVL